MNTAPPRIAEAIPMLSALSAVSTLMRESGHAGLPAPISLILSTAPPSRPPLVALRLDDDADLDAWATWLGKPVVERPASRDVCAEAFGLRVEVWVVRHG